MATLVFVTIAVVIGELRTSMVHIRSEKLPPTKMADCDLYLPSTCNAVVFTIW